MKKSTEILSLPIISIADGVEIGSVKSLVVNPEKGSVDFLTIEHEDWQVSVKAIPFKKVIGIGEYAVTVENGNAVIDLNEIPIANALVNKKIRINDTKVMSRKGQLIGEAKEYFVDDETGYIIGILVGMKESEKVLSAEQILTYGKDILIVKEDSAGRFMDSVEELLPETQEEPELDLEENTSIDIENIRNKQAGLLKGKRVTKDITGVSGETIISSGTILTEEDISRAQTEGPSVFVELTMNTQD
ncbi:photosystem reaction center subunit H [Rossellomorea vietnamensis]|uniref:Photosystem reaction center subunit H n=1 Tax=Rossellomorea vietnamensis TaxID=218284 RepID=A0A5D4P1Q0_9BACI|nr:PRC-barrel domain-containing protein [Rossellomorea vietnamensis]TYS19636.1 photosystem reaction center subunit H [Rossellomorea vietnamensis]